MHVISWWSVLFYCLFSMFVFYQQLHVKNFQGSSQVFYFLLTLSGFCGMIVGLVFLVYYGWTVAWWAPLVIFACGVLFMFLGALLEHVVGALAMSLMGFVAWPVCAYLMFRFIPRNG